jgi:hypothetical protein
MGVLCCIVESEKTPKKTSPLRSAHLHLKVNEGSVPKPPLCRGLCLRRRPLELGQAPGARGLADGYGYIAHLQNLTVARGSPAPTPPISAALGLSCRWFATAGNDALGKWGMPPPHRRLPLRSACLADSSLPWATKRLAGGSYRPHTPAFFPLRSASLV